MNVTVDLVAWNATAGPAVSHSGVYTIAALGSKRVLTFDLGDTLQEAGASPDQISEFFLRCTVRGPPASPVVRHLSLSLHGTPSAACTGRPFTQHACSYPSHCPRMHAKVAHIDVSSGAKEQPQ